MMMMTKMTESMINFDHNDEDNDGDNDAFKCAWWGAWLEADEKDKGPANDDLALSSCDEDDISQLYETACNIAVNSNMKTSSSPNTEGPEISSLTIT